MLGVLFANVPVSDPPYGPRHHAPSVNQRLPLEIATHDAPDPVRQSDFNDEGKPVGHAKSHATIAMGFNKDTPYNQLDDFAYQISLSAPTYYARRPYGHQSSVEVLLNIPRPEPSTYADLVSE